jgi:hypothetical protein
MLAEADAQRLFPSCAGIWNASLSRGSGTGLRRPERRTAATVDLPANLEQGQVQRGL